MHHLPASLFQSAFDHAAIGMAVVALDGRCRKANRSLCGFLGYTENELLRLRFQEFTHPDDLERDRHWIALLLGGKKESFQLEKRYIHKNGRVLWANLSVSLAYGNSGEPECFVSQIQDITARKEAEQDRDTLMGLPLVFQCVIGVDGFARRVSPSFTEAFGYSEKELRETWFVEFFHPDDRAATAAEIQGMVLGGNTRFFQNRFRCKSGLYRWILWCGIGVPERHVIYAIGTDITPLKVAEENAMRMLEEKEELIRQLQDSAAEIQRLRGHLITVCAWTKRIRYNDEWMAPDDFLIKHLGLNLTHGMPDEALLAFLREHQQ